MRTKTYSFYDPDTGIFSGRTFTGYPDLVKSNTPDGLVAIEGWYDHLSCKIEIKSGDITDYQPPQPSDEHEWDTETKRWEVKPYVIAARTAANVAQEEIAALEAGSLRRLREIVLSLVEDPELRAVDNEIAEKRPALNGLATGLSDKPVN